jgi:hypothetical protein
LLSTRSSHVMRPVRALSFFTLLDIYQCRTP